MLKYKYRSNSKTHATHAAETENSRGQQIKKGQKKVAHAEREKQIREAGEKKNRKSPCKIQIGVLDSSSPRLLSC